MYPKKILIVKLSSLGDIIHTFPMIYDIKQHFPNLIIDWAVDQNFIELVKLNDSINTVFAVPFRSRNIRKILKFIFLKKEKYDLIIDCQGLIKSAFVTKLFDGITYGFSVKSIKEKLATLFYKNKIFIPKCNVIQKNRLFAAKIFHYSINDEINFGLNNLMNINLDIHYSWLQSKQYIICFHASSDQNKCLSSLDWLSIIKYVHEKYNYSVILPFGNHNEYQQAHFIKNSINCNVFIPDTVLTYLELVKLILKAKFIIGVDTGLVHLSNALNKNMIAIYNYTNPINTGIFESKRAKNIFCKTQINIQKIILELNNINQP